MDNIYYPKNMDYKLDVIDNIPVLVPDGQQINNTNRLNIVEIVEMDPCLKLKIRWCDNNLNIIKERYKVMKEIVQNPLIVINCPLFSIQPIIEENLDKIITR